MCIGVPARVLSIDGAGENPMPMGVIDVKGEQRPCCFGYVPEAQAGDWVLIQTGFAMEIIDETTARESLATIDEFDLLPSQRPTPGVTA